MQNGIPIRPLAALFLAAGTLGFGCVKEISSEERLDRETRYLKAEVPADAQALAAISCQDAAIELVKARSESQPEAARLSSYQALYESLAQRTSRFEEAMKRNPDLAYMEGSRALVAAKDLCVEQTADVRVEFERYLRELVEVPTVQELKGGSTTTVARLDFETLRKAIEVLDPDDKDQLLGKVASAEKKIEARPEPKRRGR